MPRDRVYAQWQEDLAAIEYEEEAVFAEVERLGNASKAYKLIVDPSETLPPPVRVRLERLRQWGSNVYHPVALQIVGRLLNGSLTAEDAAESLLYVESFMVRRMLIGTPTNNLNRTFTTTAGQMALLDKQAYALNLRKALSSTGKYWPNDNEVLAGVATEPFYKIQRASQRQYVLRRLEEAMPGKEKPDWSATDFTLEHVMPQHPTEAWVELLKASGEIDPVITHQELVHVLGNITLTSENSVLSDHPLERKKEILATSVLKLNKEIEQTDTWDRSTIESRGRKLAELAITIWPAPLDPNESLESDWRTTLAGVLQFLPDGEWTTLDDLAELLEEQATELRDHLAASNVPGRERILQLDGTIDSSFPWVASNLSAFRNQLVALGVFDDLSNSVAATSRRASPETLTHLASGE